MIAACVLAAATIAGLDHIPIAVGDLDAAAADYRRLGFVLKPGRAHDNGLRNHHAKFADGTELELITAPAVTDALTATYRKHLESGDGPAFLALHAPAGPPAGDAPPYVFFGGLNRSPTDRPEHFAHPNTATSLIAVWLAGDLSRERAMLASGGATFAERTVHAPEPARATVARIGEDDVILLPASRRLIADRAIVGATVRVRSLASAKRALAKIPTREVTGSVFVPPEAAHGLWIELRE